MISEPTSPAAWHVYNHQSNTTAFFNRHECKKVLEMKIWGCSVMPLVYDRTSKPVAWHIYDPINEAAFFTESLADAEGAKGRGCAVLPMSYLSANLSRGDAISPTATD